MNESSLLRSAFIYEIFSGIQGEGPLVGERQIFVRFCRCNLRCRYCDTPAARKEVAQARVEIAPGSRRFEAVPNPITVEDVVRLLKRLDVPRRLHHSVSLTGGEPLVHVRFLCELLPAVRRLGLMTYLETNGTLPTALTEIIRHVDIVAMDVKLASSTGQTPRYGAHQKFLRIARRKTCFVKVIITSRCREEELQRVGQLVRRASPKAVIVLQPVTPLRTGILPPSPTQMLEFQRIVKVWTPSVRVIPQVHRLMGQM